MSIKQEGIARKSNLSLLSKFIILAIFLISLQLISGTVYSILKQRRSSLTQVFGTQSLFLSQEGSDKTSLPFLWNKENFSENQRVSIKISQENVESEGFHYTNEVDRYKEVSKASRTKV